MGNVEHGKGTLRNWPKEPRADAEDAQPRKTASRSLLFLSLSTPCTMVRLSSTIENDEADTQPLIINARYRLCRKRFPTGNERSKADDCCLSALSLRIVAVSTLEEYYKKLL